MTFDVEPTRVPHARSLPFLGVLAVACLRGGCRPVTSCWIVPQRHRAGARSRPPPDPVIALHVVAGRHHDVGGPRAAGPRIRRRGRGRQPASTRTGGLSCTGTSIEWLAVMTVSGRRLADDTLGPRPPETEREGDDEQAVEGEVGDLRPAVGSHREEADGEAGRVVPGPEALEQEHGHEQWRGDRAAPQEGRGQAMAARLHRISLVRPSSGRESAARFGRATRNPPTGRSRGPAAPGAGAAPPGTWMRFRRSRYQA